jgi:hypothetical protein
LTSGFVDDVDVDILDDVQPDDELIEHDLVDELIPDSKRKWGEFADFRLVGNGDATNGYCGQFFHKKGCLRVDLHNLVLNPDFHGKVFVRNVRNWCCKPSCPVCFKQGWAVREAGNIKERIDEGRKHFGLAEHVVCSVPVKDYGLNLKQLRRKAVVVLYKRGVIGGCLIFHGFRYRPDTGWRWSPHFHVIGFILGGYARCRNCKFLRERNCQANCDGFHARAWRLFNEDGYYVKVLGKRKTVFGTAWYQLHHSTYEVGGKRHVVATWFGCCSYRKLKVTKEVRKELCPICNSELVEVRYVGLYPEQFSDKKEVFADYREDGEVVWVEVKRIKGIAGARIPSHDLIDEVFPEQNLVVGCVLPRRVNF